jgi:hypothetical protein
MLAEHEVLISRPSSVLMQQRYWLVLVQDYCSYAGQSIRALGANSQGDHRE